MIQHLKSFSLAITCVIAGFVSSANAGGYVVQSFYAPAPIYVAPAPVYAPVVPAIVPVTYYAPAPVYTYRPVVVAPAPVVVAPTRVVQTTNVTRHRVAVRSREYTPYSIFPASNQVYVERWTPHGVVVRHRGY